MISNRTRQKYQNMFGWLGLAGLAGTLHLFFDPAVRAWVPAMLLLLLGVGIWAGYEIFPRTLSRSDLYRTSQIGLSLERLWFAVACGVGIWALLAGVIIALAFAMGVITAPPQPAPAHQAAAR